MEIRKFMDELPFIVKVLLAIFFAPLYGGIYRLAPLTTKALIIGILWIVTGAFFTIGGIVDIVCVVLHKKPTVLVD
jgi:ATP/ADP translocase